MPEQGDDSPRTLLRRPTAEDGAAIWSLIRACRPLDENSMYCNLIQATHFRETCILAERYGRLIGWISGHILPDDPETLFIWQVAVAQDARGQGLAPRMLDALLDRDICADVMAIETTITDDNAASWAMFDRFASRCGARTTRDDYFDSTKHFGGAQKSEYRLRICLPLPVQRAA